jgi:hypothetical protein
MRRSALFPCLLVIVSACASTNNAAIVTPATALPVLTKTATPTSPPATETVAPTIITSTPTSTPVPPLVAHQWVQAEPLITFTNGWGDGRCGFEEDYPIQFTLLPTGELDVLTWNDKLQASEILTTALSQQATCNLLNSIDQAGFFDYDPSTYVKDPKTWNRPIIGPDNTYISVQAWRANSVNLYFLNGFLNRETVDEIRSAWADCSNCGTPEFPTILPAIRDTYRMLDQYQPETLHILEPGRLGVWIDAYPGTNGVVGWPLRSRTLAGAISPKGYAGATPNMILTGTNATWVYKALNQSFNVCGMDVRDGDKVYRVFARPLLPDEFTGSPLPKISLSCSPSDGWVPVP